jgi:putative protein-disulfide isomerase
MTKTQRKWPQQLATLHYIFDPFCGWCYGAAPLIKAAAELSSLQISMHGCGMLTGSRRRLMSAQWRSYVLAHDERIADLTGQIFGFAYKDGALLEHDLILDSAEPTRLVLAAADQGKALQMLLSLQSAFYQHGRTLADPLLLAELTAELGLSPLQLKHSLLLWSDDKLQRHFYQSRQLLELAGGQGFPGFVLQKHEGEALLLDHHSYYGKPDDWIRLLQSQLG